RARPATPLPSRQSLDARLTNPVPGGNPAEREPRGSIWSGSGPRPDGPNPVVSGQVAELVRRDVHQKHARRAHRDEASRVLKNAHVEGLGRDSQDQLDVPEPPAPGEPPGAKLGRARPPGPRVEREPSREEERRRGNRPVTADAPNRPDHADSRRSARTSARIWSLRAT